MARICRAGLVGGCLALLVFHLPATARAPSQVKREQASPVRTSIRGIYLIITMDSDLASGSKVLQLALANRDVDGVYIRTSWAKVEPQPGRFDWTYLDRQIKAAAERHKRVSIGVDAGQRSPSWLYAEGVARFNTVVQIPRQADFCAPVSVPIPWDAKFLAAQDELIAAMGRHFAADPTVVAVKVTSIGYRTDEVLLPHTHARWVQGEAIAGRRWCHYPDDIDRWIAAGYSGSKLTDAFSRLLVSVRPGTWSKLAGLRRPHLSCEARVCGPAFCVILLCVP